MSNDECLRNFPFGINVLTYKERKTFTVSIITLIPIIIVSNMLLIYLLFKTKQIRLVINYFVMAMSISDTFGACILIPLTAIYFEFLPSSRVIEVSVIFCSNAFTNFSALMVLTIATDRYVHTCHLRSIYLSMSHLKAKLIIIGSFSLTLGSASCLSWFYHNNTNTKQIFLGTYIYGAILLIIIGLLYTRVYFKARCSIRPMKRESSDEVTTDIRLPRHTLFLTKTVAIILLSLICCYLPFLTVGMVITTLPSKEICVNGTGIFLFYLSGALVYVNNAVNALTIIFRNRALKGYLLRTRDSSKAIENTQKITWIRPKQDN